VRIGTTPDHGGERQGDYLRGGTGGTVQQKPEGPGPVKFHAGRPEPPVKPAAAPGAAPGTPGARNDRHPIVRATPRPAYTLPPGFGAGGGKTTMLSKENGDSLLHQVNSARGNLGGINNRRLPGGVVSVHGDGAVTVSSRGRKYDVRQDGTLASYTARGATARFRPDGKLRNLHTGKLDIVRGPHDERRIFTVRPDDSVLVSTGPKSGYLQRKVVVKNITVIQRTYVVNNTVYTRSYTPYSYRGADLIVYRPAGYYEPDYYRWVGTGWGAPVRYSWGTGDPSYQYYRGYYVPADSYLSPSEWLADYLVRETLRAAYLERMQEQAREQEPDPSADDPMPPGTRDRIARQIQWQLARERRAATDPNRPSDVGTLQSLLNDTVRTFIVSTSLVVPTLDGGECGLTAGAVLRPNRVPEEEDQVAEMNVVSSRRADCPAQTVVTLTFEDLQEMDNKMRERLYAGLDALGRDPNGDLPAPPPAQLRNTGPEPGAADDNVLAMLKTQQSEADQAEDQVLNSAFAEDQSL